MLNPRRLNHDLHLPSLVGQEFNPRKSNDRQWFSSCPFHDEKTGSLSITYKKDRGWCYYCHGCHETGDTIKFLQKYHGITFRQVLARYGDESGDAVTEILESEANRWLSRVPDLLLLCDRPGCSSKLGTTREDLLAVLEGDYCGWEVAPDGLGALCPIDSKERQAR